MVTKKRKSLEYSTGESPILMYIAEPFFSIYLPSKGSSMGSKVSPASSKITGFPRFTAFSRTLLIYLGSIVGFTTFI